MFVEVGATKVTFGDLEMGDSFRYDDDVFIKTETSIDGSNNAVNLSTGKFDDFIGSDVVFNRNRYKVVPVGDSP